MIKVIVCGRIQLEGGDIASSVERCASEAGVQCSLTECDSPIDLVDMCTSALLEEPFELVICAVELLGVSGVQVVSELNSLHSFADDLRVVLCAKSPEFAYDAQTLGVGGYLIEPVSRESFDKVVGGQIETIVRKHAESAIIRCRDRVRRIAFSRISYAETAGHYQVLHHIGSDLTCEMRGSSRDLFSLLEADGRFFKVGSSHIVNLDYVAQLDSKAGFVTLTDGVEVPVPVRARKQLERALCDRGQSLGTQPAASA